LENLDELLPRRVFRSRALKRQIVEETLQPGASVSRVARKYGVNANQVFCWRRLYQQGGLALRPKDLASVADLASAHAAGAAPALLPVQVVDVLPVQAGAAAHGDAAGTGMYPANSHPHSSVRTLVAGSIHIELGQARLRIDGAADAATLRTVLGCLRSIEG
jgi:transposase